MTPQNVTFRRQSRGFLPLPYEGERQGIKIGKSKQLVRMKSLFNDPSPTVVDQLEIYFSQPVDGILHDFGLKKHEFITNIIITNLELLT